MHGNQKYDIEAQLTHNVGAATYGDVQNGSMIANILKNGLMNGADFYKAEIYVDNHIQKQGGENGFFDSLFFSRDGVVMVDDTVAQSFRHRDEFWGQGAWITGRRGRYGFGVRNPNEPYWSLLIRTDATDPTP